MSTTAHAHSESRTLHVALWVTQLLLAAAFLAAGTMKSTAPIDTLSANMPWVGYSPAWLVRFVGVSEVLGAIGLIVPAATRVLPVLTPVAASALTLVMVLAFGMHGWHGELGVLPVNVVLGSLTVFVAWGRFTAAPITR